MTGLRTAPAAILLLAMVVAAAIFTAAPPISGDEPRETVILPTITISATGGVTTVTEGMDISLTITADPAPATPLEVWVYFSTRGDFTDLPPPDPERYITDPDSDRTVTVAAGSTTAILLVATNDDDHDEENGYVFASLPSRVRTYIVGDDATQSMQVQDNDITLPPEKMHPPTVLAADGRLEIFWEEPPPPDAIQTPTQGREINKYLIRLSGRGEISVDGYQRHHSVTPLTNGFTRSLNIRACRAFTRPEIEQCSAISEAVVATPTVSGPTITGPTSPVGLNEESAASVGEFSAVSTTPGAITWRLGGEGLENFTQTVNSDGTLTLTMNTGVSFEGRRLELHHGNIFNIVVVATDSGTARASSVSLVTVNIVDVDETPTFAENLIVKPPYVVGERIEYFVLPAPRADERPITYKMLTEDALTGLDLPAERKLPPGIGLFGSRLISGTPTQAGSYTATYAATDVDGDVGTLDLQFTVIDIHAPTVATQIADQDMSATDSPRAIELSDKFEDPDGDDLTYTAPSGNIGVVTTGTSGSVLTLTPVAEGTATITVTATDPSGRSGSQEFIVTVASATIAITPTGATISKGSSTTFLVTGTGLDPAETYSLEVTLDGEKAAFDEECTKREGTENLPSGLTGARDLFPVPPEPRAKLFHIYGCKLGEVEITARIFLGTVQLHQTQVKATVTGTPDKPLIRTISTADGSVTLEIELGHGVGSYVVKQYQGITPTPLPFGSFTLSRTKLSTANTGPTTSIASISGLTNGVAYRYQVVSRNDNGESTSDDHIVDLPHPPQISTITLARGAGTEIEITEGETLNLTFTLTATPTPTSNLTVHLKITEEPDRAWLSPNALLTRHSEEYWQMRVTIPANEATADFTLAIEQDDLDEPHGEIDVRVEQDILLRYHVGTEFLRVVNIRDDDTLEPPSQVYANGHVDNDLVSVWWNSSTGATSYQLRFAVETCPDTALDEPSHCTANQADFTELSIPTGTSKQLQVGTDSDDDLPLSTGAYDRDDPSGVYRLQIQSVNEIGVRSAWSSPSFIYPTDTPPVPSTNLILGSTSKLPIIATAHLYGYQPDGILTYIICEDTIPASIRGNSALQINAEKIENTIEKWQDAIKQDHNTSLIRTDKLFGPIPEKACKPRTSGQILTQRGYNAIMFADREQMDRATCSAPYRLDRTDPRSCWRSPTIPDAAIQAAVGALVTLPPIIDGTIFIRTAPTPDGASSDWITPGHNGTCLLLEHAISHEIGHALGIGQLNPTSAQYHPRNSTLSIMSDGNVHNTYYCSPQAYDVVAIAAIHQSR